MPVVSPPVRKLAAAVAVALVSAAMAVTGVAASSAAPASRHVAQTTYQTDHQLCYVAAAAGPGIQLPPAGSITLHNQFGSFKPTLSRADQHCNPVEKIMPDGQVFPITNRGAHLLCWKITAGTTKQPPLTVSNQFGSATLSLGAASQLCLPTWKSLTAPPHKTPRQPPGLSHYTCYPVQNVASGGYKAPQPRLQDEFATNPMPVSVTFTPAQLCVPTTKTVVTKAGTKVYKIVPGAMELLCFPVSQTPRKTPVFDQDQFTGPGVPMTIERTLGLCVPSTTPTPHLYWANSSDLQGDPNTGTIVEAKPDGTGAQAIASGQDVPFGVAVGASHLYWANGDSGTIVEANLDGTGAQVINSTSFAPSGVAVDASHLYWTDSDAETIVEANLDGTGAQVIASGQAEPLGVAVGASHLYWTNYLAGTIVEANLDGTGAQVIASGQADPFGVAVGASHLYWANAQAGTIVEANPDGTGAHVIASGQDYPNGVAVDASHLYWANAYNGTIVEANLDGTGAQVIASGQDYFPVGVAVGPQ